MRIIFSIVVLLALLAGSGCSRETGRPNVIFILSDDQGWTDYSFMGHPHIQASNIDIPSTILNACGIPVPEAMNGLDLRGREALRKRNRVVVEVYDHDSDLDRLEDLDNGLKARVVIEGWDKWIRFPGHTELYDLKLDPHEKNDLSSEYPEKVERLEKGLEQWGKEVTR